jgi:hypothetical protein
MNTHSTGVNITVHSHRLDAQTSASADHSASNLATIGHQDLVKFLKNKELFSYL